MIRISGGHFEAMLIKTEGFGELYMPIDFTHTYTLNTYDTYTCNMNICYRCTYTCFGIYTFKQHVFGRDQPSPLSLKRDMSDSRNRSFYLPQSSNCALYSRQSVDVQDSFLFHTAALLAVGIFRAPRLTDLIVLIYPGVMTLPVVT